MQMRTSRPTAGNKFYITTAAGGYSYCIQGYPTDSQCNVLSNCVGYACGRFNEIIGAMKYPYLNCNAEYFIERAQSLGLSTGQTPKPGAIMVWANGSIATAADGAGHVEIVEKVISPTQVYTSGSSYGGTAYFNTTRNKGASGKWGYETATFRGFIYNPAVKEGEASTGSTTTSLSGYTDAQLADMVLAGKFGNGDARKAALGSRYAAVQAIVNQKAAGTYTAPVAKKSNSTIAQEVIDGKWGNGEDRKKKLTAAGYDYNAIQTLVNQKVAASSKKSNAVIAEEVLAGKWGNGEDRKKRLAAAGYDYAAIQAIVNQKAGGTKTLGVGSRIKVRQGATDLNTGGTYAAFVYNTVYIVKEISGNRVVFGTSGAVIGAIAKGNAIIQ